MKGLMGPSCETDPEAAEHTCLRAASPPRRTRSGCPAGRDVERGAPVTRRNSPSVIILVDRIKLGRGGSGGRDLLRRLGTGPVAFCMGSVDEAAERSVPLLLPPYSFGAERGEVRCEVRPFRSGTGPLSPSSPFGRPTIRFATAGDWAQASWSTRTGNWSLRIRSEQSSSRQRGRRSRRGARSHER